MNWTRFLRKKRPKKQEKIKFSHWQKAKRRKERHFEGALSFQERGAISFPTENYERRASPKKYKDMNINPFNLKSIPLQDRHLLPSVSGVYFVFYNGKIEYIGISKNIFQRWQQHECCIYLESPPKCRLAWFVIENDKEREKTEKDLIEKFQPRINIQNISRRIEATKKIFVREKPVKNQSKSENKESVLTREVFTVRELAQKFKVAKRVALKWCEQGLLPNAKKMPSGFGFDIWLIPESDFNGFVKPECKKKSLTFQPKDFRKTGAQIAGYLTVEETAEYLNLTGGRVRQLIGAKKIPSIKVGQVRLIKQADLSAF